MATNLKTIKGVNVNQDKTQPGVKLTTFYGGKERGMCVQLTIPTPARGGGAGWTELDVQGVRELRDQLETIIAGNYKQYEGD